MKGGPKDPPIENRVQKRVGKPLSVKEMLVKLNHKNQAEPKGEKVKVSNPEPERGTPEGAYHLASFPAKAGQKGPKGPGISEQYNQDKHQNQKVKVIEKKVYKQSNIRGWISGLGCSMVNLETKHQNLSFRPDEAEAEASEAKPKKGNASGRLPK